MFSYILNIKYDVTIIIKLHKSYVPAACSSMQKFENDCGIIFVFKTNHAATQCSAAVQEREIREIKLRKRLNAMQRGSARKRNQTNKVDEEAQCSVVVQKREIREIKSSKRLNATQRGSASRKRNQTNDVTEEVQCKAARQ